MIISIKAVLDIVYFNMLAFDVWSITFYNQIQSSKFYLGEDCVKYKY